MQPDDVMPNDGTYFFLQQPEQQKISQTKEKAQTLEALPILQDVIKRLKQRVDFYASVDSIPDETKLDPNKFLIAYNVNQLMRDNLRSELEWITNLVEEHAHKR